MTDIIPTQAELEARMKAVLDSPNSNVIALGHVAEWYAQQCVLAVHRVGVPLMELARKCRELGARDVSATDDERLRVAKEFCGGEDAARYLVYASNPRSEGRAMVDYIIAARKALKSAEELYSLALAHLIDQSTQRQTERIVAAAIQVRGVTFSVSRPGRHDAVIKAIVKSGIADWRNEQEQGFLTDRGRFVDREEAAGIAYRAGQAEKVSMLTTESIENWSEP